MEYFNGSALLLIWLLAWVAFKLLTDDGGEV